MTFWVGAIGSTVFNGLALFVGRGSFAHWFIVTVVAVYAGGAAALVSGCAYLLRNRFSSARRLARGAAVVAVVAASGPLSLIPGSALATHDIAAAEKRCESLIPAIDEYKLTHGAYPLDISLVAKSGDWSRLARACAYWSDGSHFGFNLGDPRAIMTFIGYNSSTRRWSEWH